MKKLKLKMFSILAVVLFMSTLVSVAPAAEYEEDGTPSYCAQYARNIILNAAEEYNLDISRGGAHFELMMGFYLNIYEDCLND